MRVQLVAVSSLLASATLLCACAQDVAPPVPLIEISTDRCDGSRRPVANRTKIYLKNISPDKRIAANVRYETDPAGRSFPLYDQALGPFTEQYPKDYEHRLAPGERRMIGCTEIARAGRTSGSYAAFRMNASVVGNIVVNPPAGPAENPTQFVAFLIEVGGADGACPGGSKPAGPYWIVNLHPTRRIAVEVEALDERGRRVGVLKPVLAPTSNDRLTCSNARDGHLTLGRVLSAKFTTASITTSAPGLISQAGRKSGSVPEFGNLFTD